MYFTDFVGVVFNVSISTGRYHYVGGDTLPALDFMAPRPFANSFVEAAQSMTVDAASGTMHYTIYGGVIAKIDIATRLGILSCCEVRAWKH